MTALQLTGDDRRDVWTALARHLVQISTAALPSDVSDDGTTLTLTWTPDLTPAQQTQLNLMLRRADSESGLSSTAYAAIQNEVPTLRAYFLNATPTNAQTVAAVKSIISVLRALIRDS